MEKTPKIDKTIQREAFLGRMRQLGCDNLPDRTIFVPMSELLQATDFLDIEVEESIRTCLAKAINRYKNTGVRIEAIELANLSDSNIQAFVREHVLNVGIILKEVERLGIDMGPNLEQ